MKLEILRNSEVLAWSSHATIEQRKFHTLVVTPRLALSHEAALGLVAGQGYKHLFAGAMYEDQEFQVLHATFPFYRTGEADLTNFAIVVGSAKFSLATFVNRTAEMLRCSSSA